MISEVKIPLWQQPKRMGHDQMAEWAGGPCLCRQRNWTRGFSGRGRYKSETRRLRNLDLIQTDILYNSVQYVEKPEGLRWEGLGTPAAGVNSSALVPNFSFSSFFLLAPKF